MVNTDPVPVGDEVQVTRRQVRNATWICFFAWTFAVYDFVLFGNLLPAMAEDLGWTSADSTAINTWITAGIALVAFGIGPVVDRVGRRRGIILTVCGAAVASGLTVVSGWVIGLVGGLGLVLLILVRSFSGLGYAEQAINATYLNELYASVYTSKAEARRRGFIYSLVQSGWPIGSVLAAGSVYLLFPIGGWQLPFVVAIFPVFFMVAAAKYLRESPQFQTKRELERLVKAGREDEARALSESTGVKLQEQAPLTAAFQGESRRSTLVIGTSFLLSWLGVLTFSILGTSLLSAPDGKNVTFNNALVVLVVSNATAFIGYLFHGWLGDRIGRRNAISIGWLVSGVSFTAMLLAPSGNFAVTIALYSLGLAFLIGPYSALLFFNGESFPVHTRATGGSIINAAGQVGALLGGILITFSLGAGATWTEAAYIWGAAPIFASSLLILAARNVDPRQARYD